MCVLLKELREGDEALTANKRLWRQLNGNVWMARAATVDVVTPRLQNLNGLKEGKKGVWQSQGRVCRSASFLYRGCDNFFRLPLPLLHTSRYGVTSSGCPPGVTSIR